MKYPKSVDDATKKQLDDLAHQIKTNLKKEEGYRVRYAVQLAEAKAVCAANKIPFKAWVEEHFHLSYDYCRALAKAGAADDPVLAIEDMRAGVRERVEKSKTKSGVRTPPPPADDPVEQEPADADADERRNVIDKAIVAALHGDADADDDEHDDDDDEEDGGQDEVGMRLRGLDACFRQGLKSAEDARHHIEWLTTEHPEAIPDIDNLIDAAGAAAALWATRQNSLERFKKGSAPSKARRAS
jgi:hypothetical protein